MQLMLERRVSNNSIVSYSCCKQFPKYERNEVRTSEDWQPKPMLQVHIEYLHLYGHSKCILSKHYRAFVYLSRELGIVDFHRSWCRTMARGWLLLAVLVWWDCFLNMCPNFFFNLSKDSQHIIIFSGNLKVFKSQFCTCFDSLYKIYFENCCPFPLYFSNSSFSSIPFSAFGGNCLTFCCIQVPDV